MGAENALLRDMRLERLRGLQDEKAALAAAYEAELRRLRAAPEIAGALAPEARLALEEGMRRFRAEDTSDAARLPRRDRGATSADGGAGPDHHAAGPPASRGDPLRARPLPRAARFLRLQAEDPAGPPSSSSPDEAVWAPFCPCRPRRGPRRRGLDGAGEMAVMFVVTPQTPRRTGGCGCSRTGAPRSWFDTRRQMAFQVRLWPRPDYPVASRFR
jgi:hypothetical protein